jgi:hypothetical protein
MQKKEKKSGEFHGKRQQTLLFCRCTPAYTAIEHQRNSHRVLHAGECIAEVKQLDLQTETEIRAVLIKRVKVYNYVPPNVEEEYARAILEEYRKLPG